MEEVVGDQAPLPDDEQRRRDNALLDATCDRLMEHFSSVVVITTRYCAETGRTVQAYSSKGNLAAVIQSAREFVMEHDVDVREHRRRRWK